MGMEGNGSACCAAVYETRTEFLDAAAVRRASRSGVLSTRVEILILVLFERRMERMWWWLVVGSWALFTIAQNNNLEEDADVKPVCKPHEMKQFHDLFNHPAAEHVFNGPQGQDICLEISFKVLEMYKIGQMTPRTFDLCPCWFSLRGNVREQFNLIHHHVLPDCRFHLSFNESLHTMLHRCTELGDLSLASNSTQSNFNMSVGECENPKRLYLQNTAYKTSNVYNGNDAEFGSPRIRATIEGNSPIWRGHREIYNRPRIYIDLGEAVMVSGVATQSLDESDHAVIDFVVLLGNEPFYNPDGDLPDEESLVNVLQANEGFVTPSQTSAVQEHLFGSGKSYRARYVVIEILNMKDSRYMSMQVDVMGCDAYRFVWKQLDTSDQDYTCLTTYTTETLLLPDGQLTKELTLDQCQLLVKLRLDQTERNESYRAYIARPASIADNAEGACYSYESVNSTRAISTGAIDCDMNNEKIWQYVPAVVECLPSSASTPSGEACNECEGLGSYPCAASTGSGTCVEHKPAVAACLVSCNLHEHVVGGACTACPGGTYRKAGDDPNIADTSCSSCEVMGATFCALEELYHATSGLLWENKLRWLEGDPCAPAWFGLICAGEILIGLDLRGNNLAGTIPSSFTSLTSVVFVRLSLNHLSGTIPHDIFSRMTSLGSLQISGNDFEGVLPAQLPESGSSALTWYEFNNNEKLSGTLPETLVQMTELIMFRGHDTNINGSIPDGIGLLSNLGEFRIDGTRVSGIIPPGIIALEHLSLAGRDQGLSLPNNAFQCPTGATSVKLASGSYSENCECHEWTCSGGFITTDDDGTITEWSSSTQPRGYVFVDIPWQTEVVSSIGVIYCDLGYGGSTVVTWVPGHHSAYPAAACFENNDTNTKMELRGCAICEPGKFNGKVDSGSPCTECTPGTYASESGALVCDACAPGFFQHLAGQSECVKPMPGFFVSSASQDYATPCAPGTYTSGYGASACRECEIGDEQLSSGQSACVPNINVPLSVGLFIGSAMVDAVALAVVAWCAVTVRRNRKNKIIMATSPVLSYVILSGLAFVPVSNILDGVWRLDVSDSAAAAACEGSLWALVMGLTRVSTAILARNYRVFRVFLNSSLRRVAISNQELIRTTFVVESLIVMLLAVWSGAYGATIKSRVLLSGERETTCKKNGSFLILVITGVLALVQLAGWYVIYRIFSANIRMNEYDETKAIAVTFTFTGFVAIFNLFVREQLETHALSYLLDTCVCTVLVAVPVVVLFVTRFYTMDMSNKFVRQRSVGKDRGNGMMGRATAKNMSLEASKGSLNDFDVSNNSINSNTASASKRMSGRRKQKVREERR